MLPPPSLREFYPRWEGTLSLSTRLEETGVDRCEYLQLSGSYDRSISTKIYYLLDITLTRGSRGFVFFSGGVMCQEINDTNLLKTYFRQVLLSATFTKCSQKIQHTVSFLHSFFLYSITREDGTHRPLSLSFSQAKSPMQFSVFIPHNRNGQFYTFHLPRSLRHTTNLETRALITSTSLLFPVSRVVQFDMHGQWRAWQIRQRRGGREVTDSI